MRMRASAHASSALAPQRQPRLAARVDEWGSQPEERALVKHLHTTREDLPENAIAIDTSQPLNDVVDIILGHCGQHGP